MVPWSTVNLCLGFLMVEKIKMIGMLLNVVNRQSKEVNENIQQRDKPGLLTCILLHYLWPNRVDTLSISLTRQRKISVPNPRDNLIREEPGTEIWAFALIRKKLVTKLQVTDWSVRRFPSSHDHHKSDFLLLTFHAQKIRDVFVLRSAFIAFSWIFHDSYWL